MFGLKLIRETISDRHLMPRPLWHINFPAPANKISFDLQVTACSQESCDRQGWHRQTLNFRFTDSQTWWRSTVSKWFGQESWAWFWCTQCLSFRHFYRSYLKKVECQSETTKRRRKVVVKRWRTVSSLFKNLANGSRLIINHSVSSIRK